MTLACSHLVRAVGRTTGPQLDTSGRGTSHRCDTGGERCGGRTGSRPEIMLHLAAEGWPPPCWLPGCAAAGGRDRPGGGAALSTVIASPGYFLARRERAPVSIMVAVLLALTATAASGPLVM